MTAIYIPVGLPGCGKSTLGHNLFGAFADIHATDEIRAEFGDVNDMSNNKKVFETYHARIAESLSVGTPVYTDATNLDLRARNTLIDIARDYKAEAHAFLFSNVREAIVRNAARSRVVPDDVMLRFVYKLEASLNSVPHEPFTSVTMIDGVSGVTQHGTFL